MRKNLNEISLEKFWKTFVDEFVKVEKKWIIILNSFWIITSTFILFIIDFIFYPNSTWFCQQ